MIMHFQKLAVRCLAYYDVNPLSERMLLGPGVSTAGEGAHKPEVKHLQLKCCNRLGFKNIIN